VSIEPRPLTEVGSSTRKAYSGLFTQRFDVRQIAQSARRSFVGNEIITADKWNVRFINAMCFLPAPSIFERKILEIFVHGLGGAQGNDSNRSFIPGVLGKRSTGKLPRFQREHPNQGYTLSYVGRFPQIRIWIPEMSAPYGDATISTHGVTIPQFTGPR